MSDVSFNFFLFFSDFLIATFYKKSPFSHLFVKRCYQKLLVQSLLYPNGSYGSYERYGIVSTLNSQLSILNSQFIASAYRAADARLAMGEEAEFAQRK